MLKKLIFGLIGLVLVAGIGGWLWMKSGESDDLKLGDTAPAFAAEGALDGKPFNFTLAEKLAKGPLVLYFFPKVFTQGCTLEAREFAEKTAEFEAAGASVVGMSADPIGEVTKFSAEECRDKFAVASATPQIIADYGVALAPGAPMTSRTSFVIAPDGKIKMVYSAMDYKQHVSRTLAAVKALNTQ